MKPICSQCGSFYVVNDCTEDPCNCGYREMCARVQTALPEVSR